MNLKIQSVDKTHYNLNAVYLDTNNKLNKEKMLNITRTLQKEQEDHNKNIIIGDFNFIHNDKDKPKGLNSTDKLLNTIWVPFLENTDMIDPFREQLPKRKIWSFIGTGAAGKSRIDRVYVNSIMVNCITQMHYIQTPFNGHKILTFTLNKQNEKGPSYYKLNTSIITDIKYKDLVMEALA